MPFFFREFMSFYDICCMSCYYLSKICQCTVRNVQDCFLSLVFPADIWSAEVQGFFCILFFFFFQVKYNWVSRSSSDTDSPHPVLRSYLNPYRLTDLILSQISQKDTSSTERFKTGFGFGHLNSIQMLLLCL